MQIERESAARAEVDAELDAGVSLIGAATESCTEAEGKAALEQLQAKERDAGASEEQLDKRCGTKVHNTSS